MGDTGLEPVTSSVSCWRASQLRQSPGIFYGRRLTPWVSANTRIILMLSDGASEKSHHAKLGSANISGADCSFTRPTPDGAEITRVGDTVFGFAPEMLADPLNSVANPTFLVRGYRTRSVR